MKKRGVTMALIKEEDVRLEEVLSVAKKMAIAARTAPKAKGVDNLEIAILTGPELVSLANHMTNMVKKGSPKFFLRDAGNVLASQALFVIGTKIKSFGIPTCGWCGLENCAEKVKSPDTPCVFNTTDLGIAVGSAASIAMDNRVDNRIMYSVGKAVVDMGILGPDIKLAYGIPLSVSGKSPFFDRG